jgi:hypothetical protein
MLVVAVSSLFVSVSAQECTITRNFFETLGGRSDEVKIKSSNGCKTMEMDTGFEKITLTLGSIPQASTEFTILNHDNSPGSSDVAVKYYYYSGNEVETLTFADDGKTAYVCKNGGQITVTWSGVKFRGVANGKVDYITKLEMTCGPKPKATSDQGATTTTTTTDGGNTKTITSESSSSSNTSINLNTPPATPAPAPVDPDAQLKSDIATLEQQLTEHTKTITAKEFELKDKKSKKQVDSVDAVIAQYDIDIIKLKRDETKLALERSTKTLDKSITVDGKQNYIAREEEQRQKVKLLESERNPLAEIKAQNTQSVKAVADLTARIKTYETDIAASQPANAMDSLNLSVKKIELERMKYEVEKNKLVTGRTGKAMRGKLTTSLTQDYATKEDSFQQKINDCNKRIGEQQVLIKAESKKVRKENTKAKVVAAKEKLKSTLKPGKKKK